MFHHLQADSLALLPGGWQSLAVIRHFQAHGAIPLREANRHFARLTMLDRVVYRLLRDAEEVRRGLVVPQPYRRGTTKAASSVRRAE